MGLWECRQRQTRSAGRVTLLALRNKMGRQPPGKGRDVDWKAKNWETAAPLDSRPSKAEEKEVSLATGPSPMWGPVGKVALRKASVATADEPEAEEAAPMKMSPRTIDWDNPGLNVVERARLAAEEGWDEEKWNELGADWNDEELERNLPRAFRTRRKATTAPTAIKDYVEKHQLGNRKLRKLKRGIHRPVMFSGSDPVHNGIIDAVDDGKDTKLGRLAVAVHKGFLRLRASSLPGGLRGQPGVFPTAERPEIAFIGASNVGKSSLLNSLTRTMKLAEAKDDPGVTRSMNWYKCSRLPIDIIDLPGYGYAKGSDFRHLIVDFVTKRKALRAIYILVDARTAFKPQDWKFLSSLGDTGPQKIFVMTKCDLVIPWSLAQVGTMVLQDMECVPRAVQRLIMVSSRLGQGMHELRMDIAARAIAWAEQAQKRALELQAAAGDRLEQRVKAAAESE